MSDLEWGYRVKREYKPRQSELEVCYLTGTPSFTTTLPRVLTNLAAQLFVVDEEEQQRSLTACRSLSLTLEIASLEDGVSGLSGRR